MKNLPEDPFDELAARLKKYTENPDEDIWNRISPTLHAAHVPRWVGAANAIAGIAASLVIVSLVSIGEENGVKSIGGLAPSDLPANKEVRKSPADKPESNKKIDIKRAFTHRLNSQTAKDGAQEVQREQGYLNTLKKNSKNLYGLTKNEVPVVRSNVVEVRQFTDSINALNVSSEAPSKVIQTNARLTDSIENVEPVPRPVKVLNKKESKISFYAMLSPSLSFLTLTPKSNDNLIFNGLVSPPILSMKRFGISAAFGGQIRISKLLESYGGITYYQQNQTIDYRYQSSSNIVVTNTPNPNSFTLTPVAQVQQITYAMKNIGVQAGALYLIKGNRLAHKAGVGITYQHGLEKISQDGIYNNSQSSYLSYQLLYRTEYSIDNRSKLFFQPMFSSTFISNEKTNASATNKPILAGLSIGFIRNLFVEGSKKSRKNNFMEK